MSRWPWLWGIVAAFPLIGALSIAARADDRAEIEALKKQVEALQRSDAEKQRKLDEMMDLLRQIAPQAAARRKEARSQVATQKKAPRNEPDPGAAPQATSAASAHDALDEAVREATSSGAATAPPGAAPTGTGTAQLGTPGNAAVPGTLLERPLPGQATLRLLEPSFDVMVAGGWSTANDSELQTLEGGAHDPDRRGFTLQQGELSLYGAVDPYFTAETHIVFQPDGVELEEAYGTTQRLPWGLQTKAGYYLTEFGRINPTHPHAWAWIDQPIVITRMFGGDGLRSTGVQTSWLMPLPFFSQLYLGIQNANEGEYTTSFLADEGIGGYPAVRTDTRNFGDLLYLARWANAWNIGDEVSTLLGFSGLFGPNSTGGPARTFVYGTDFTLKWRPVENFRGWPFVLWQSEGIMRDYTAEPFVMQTSTDASAAASFQSPSLAHDAATGAVTTEEQVPGRILRDWGFYSQLLYGFTHPWATGVRLEWVSGHGESVGGRSNDPTRDDRLRVSPLLQYQPSEFSRIRLQYNFDHSTALPGETASTVWVGLELLFGAHPAHQW